MLRVRLLGGLALELDGRTLAPPRSRRARALLAWLALNPGLHARGQLAARFWPDVLDESARTSLRAALAELRRALGDGAAAIVSTREAVGLTAGDGVWVDVREFERLLSADRPDEAIAAGTGELLAGMDDEWVHRAREQHAARLAQALERLAAAAEQAGDHAAAARHTRAALALDPLAEETARSLMRRLDAAGDRAAALAVHDQLAERLRTALGIAPSAATRALVQSIRAGRADPDAAPAEVPAPAAVDRVAGLLSVGRARELQRLQAAWAGAATHAGRRLALLEGEPGIGKTHLMLRFAGSVRGEAGAVLFGRCSDESLGPYEPFAEILRHCAAAIGADALSALGGSGEAELARLIGDGSVVIGNDPGARHRLFGAVDSALAAIASGRPLLLALDDLQWADRPTLLLLTWLLRAPRRSGLLVLASAREGAPRTNSALAEAIADLQRDRLVDRIALTGLAAEDVAALARGLLEHEPGAEALAATVHARSGGNAFFAEELLRDIAERGTQKVPDSIREAIGRRRGRLGEDAATVLDAAAVLGQELDPDLLAAVADLPAAAVESALDELAAAALLRPDPDGSGRVEFPHALVRDAVGAELNPLRRRRLHQRVAEALIEASEQRHLEQIAHHLHAAAGDRDRAIDYLRRAAQRALALLAYEEAASLLDRALGLLDDADDPRAGAIAIARGDALLRAGEVEAANRCFAAAAALARRRGDPELLAHAALGQAGLGVVIIDYEPERIALLEEALAGVADADPLLASRLLARLAVALYYAPARDRSESVSAEAVAVARSARDPRAVAAALNARHVALWRPDRLFERLETADEMIDAARAAGERQLELQARNWRVVDLWELGDMEEWRAEVRRHGALAGELRLPAYTWYTPLWAAVEALHAGRFEEAAPLRAQARAAGERAGDRNAPLFDEMLGFSELTMRGAFAELDLTYVQRQVANSPAGLAWRSSYAWCLAALGRTEEATEEFAAVAADRFGRIPFDANWLSSMGECAETCLLLGDRERASRLYELLAPYAGRPLTSGRAVTSYGAADRQLGGLAVLLGRTAQAVEHFEDAIRLDGAAGMRPWVERSRIALARLLQPHDA